MKNKIAFLIFISFCSNLYARGLSSISEQIFPEGIGSLVIDKNNRMPTLDMVKQLSPDMEVSIDPLEYKNQWLGGGNKYLVFKKNGVEQFRANCRCNVAKDGKVYLKNPDSSNLTINNIPVFPIVTNSNYKTEKNIGVGNTVKELIRAYKYEGVPYVIADEGSIDLEGSRLPNIEHICFRISDVDKPIKKNSIEMIRFYVKPAIRKKSVGFYKKDINAGRMTALKYELISKRMDPNATIYAIQPVSQCRIRTHLD